MTFTNVFDGQVIYPSNLSYLALSLTADVTLVWPIEQQIGGSNIVADLIDVTPTGAGFAITMPDARQASQGYTALFVNRGADTFSVEDAGGNVLLTVASGEAWNLYLRSNATENGTWGIFEAGAGTSTANAAALAGAGLKAITTTLNQRMEINSQGSNYAIVDGDRAKAVVWTGGSGDFTLPDASTLGADWFVAVRNSGSGSVTITPDAGTIDGSGTLIFATGESAFIISDGTNYFTVGYGQEVNAVFDFIALNVAGSGDFILTGAQLNRVSYRLTGVLTGNRNIIVPAAIQQYWIDNQTSGAFDLTLKTAAGTGEVIPQGQRRILYCDGTNVVSAETFIVSTPVQIADGGTGATTASGALTNLGGVSDTRTLTAGAGLSGGGDLSTDRTFSLDTSSTRNTDHAAVSITGSGGITGGGDITASRALSLDTSSTRNTDHAAVAITAGAGLTGGGDITASRTLDVGAGTGISVAADSVGLDTASTRNTDHAAVSVVGGTSLTGGGDISASRTITLLNDSASPGNSFYYGTDSGGVKGFHNLASVLNFTTLLAQDGYIRFASGPTIQWGISASIGASGFGIVTFPVAFNTTCFVALITAFQTIGSSQSHDSVRNLTTTQFRIDNRATVASQFYWIAIGD